MTSDLNANPGKTTSLTLKELTGRDIHVIHLRKAECFYGLLDALFPGCGQQHHTSASMQHRSAAVLQQHKTCRHTHLVSWTFHGHSPSQQHHVHHSEKNASTSKGWKQTENRHQSKVTGYTHKKNHTGNSPMTGTKKHCGGRRRGASFQKLPGLSHSTASSDGDETLMRDRLFPPTY